jgi:protein-tyrosine phosphatase
MIPRFSASLSSSCEDRKRAPRRVLDGILNTLGGGASGRAGAVPTSAPRRALIKGTVSVLALGSCASTLLSACGGDFAGGAGAQDDGTPTLKSVANFRDLGGAPPGYSTSDGAHVRRGQIYRADALTLSAADAATLQSLGITSVYDLRTPAESSQTPDMQVAGASYVAINVAGTAMPLSLAGMSAEELDAAMTGEWNAFVAGRVQCSAYGELLTQIAQTQGPQILTGGTGVDAVGWASALLLLIANVPLEIVVKDFLLTNAYRSTGVDAVNAAPPVQSSYLQAAFDALQSNYGDLNRYLTTGLGLTPATIDQLRSRLVS